jgi:hypothetical protein
MFHYVRLVYYHLVVIDWTLNVIVLSFASGIKWWGVMPGKIK